MRVLLINPPRFNELVGKNPGIVEENRGFNPPLGILSLAGYLKKNSSHEVEVFDAQPGSWGYDALETIFAGKKVDIVGITAMTFTLIDVWKTVRLVKKTIPGVKVILGGPHVHLYPKETINLEGVDYLMQGEGEITFLEFLNHYHDLERLRKIPGLCFIDPATKQIINNGIAPSTQDLDKLGWPARDLVNISDYTSLLGRSNMITTMFTSRGCPYRCTFCDRPYSPVISGFRWRSAKHVADEIEEIIELGISEAFIYDDTFTIRKDRVFELCDEIIRRKIKFTWDVRAHVNTISPDMLKAMRKAGCDRIHYGVEVGNDRMMREIKKNATVSKIEKVFAWTKDVGMETLAYFMFGQQTETREDMQDSIRMAKELNPSYAHFTIFCPYPGTEIYLKGLKNGLIKEDVWHKFSTNPGPGYKLPVWEEHLSRVQLQEVLVSAYKQFYLRPSYITKRVLKMRSLGEIMRKLKAGISVITMKPENTAKLRSKVRNIVPGSNIDIH